MQKDSRNDSVGQPVRLIQITDSHLYRHSDGALLGLNTRDSFDRVIDLIAAQHQNRHIDLIVGTGDIAQDAAAQSYHQFATGVSRLAAPFYWVPGNHDRRAVMLSLGEYQSAFQTRVVHRNWQILLLDTSVAGEVHGFLSADELARLEQQLSDLTDGVQHTMVCLHHNPVPGTAGWMSEIGLHNADALLAILSRHRQSVRAVVYGHIHQELDFVSDDLRFICTPSTCIQFKPHVEDFTLDLLAPAYRWFDLYDNGHLETAVERLRNYVVNVDLNAGGY